MSSSDFTARAALAFGPALCVVLILATLLRGLFPAADPPWHATVGIVWHDEGAWVHNARNRALFGRWSLDAWNPMFIAPVFTGLEYVSFASLGVGVRQARLPSQVLGVLSVALIALGVRRLAGPYAGLAAGFLLATNFVFVMWNRTAMMEGPMVAFMIASWYGYVRAGSDPRWGWLAGACAVLAFFTKAAAAFFVAALGLDAALVLALAVGGVPIDATARRAAVVTLLSLAGCAVMALAVFVAPNWQAYHFYNVEMSLTRKPSYDLHSLFTRVTWFPVLHDVFTRMWATLLIATVAGLGWLARWRTLAAGERLLLLWIGLGTAELLIHDVGNERRFVFLIPALVAVAAIALGAHRTLVAPQTASLSRRAVLVASPLIFFALYVVAGAIVRVMYLYEVRPNVRLGAAIAAACTATISFTWPRVPRALGGARWSPAAGFGLALLIAVGHLGEYAQWAAARTYKNFAASRHLGEILPAGTLVHGKLANGLALENRIKPIFVGRGFGNYADRAVRDDVRYILTYVSPSVGYESQARNSIIQDVLDAYPDRRIVTTFDVAETVTGHDTAALIDKFGSGPRRDLPPSSGRAHD